MEWSNKLVIQLLKEYRGKRELWDPSCETYRISSVKFEAWQELATMFDCEIIDVKRKMNSLLASYRRERAKVAQGVVSNWFAMSYMRFLKGPKNRDGEENINEDDDIEGIDPQMAEESILQNSDTEMSDHVSAVKIEHYDGRKTKIPRERLMRTKQNKRRIILPSHTPAANAERSGNSSRSDETRLLQALKSLQKPEKKKDECDIFGEYIANSLRKHDQRTRAMIKHAMNNILFESEMKKYNVNFQHVEINLAEDTNPLIIPDQNGTIQIEESIMAETHEDLRGQKLENIDNSYTN